MKDCLHAPHAAAPVVAVEIAVARRAAVALSGRAGAVSLARCAVEPLPEGRVVPSLTASNVIDRRAW